MKDEKKNVTKSNGAKKTSSRAKSTSSKSTSTKTKKTSSKSSSATKSSKQVKPKTNTDSVKKIETKASEKVLPNPQPVNYMTVITMLLAIVLIGIVLAKNLSNYEVADYTQSYLVRNNVVEKISCDDIPNAILGEQSFVFITSLNQEEEYKLEKKLASIIKSNHLQDDFYVYILDDQCGSVSDVTSEVSQKLLLTKSLEKVPSILYYRNGQLMDIVQREDEAMLNDGDFVKLLDIYEIAK